MTCDVFLSIGRASTDEQESFVQAVERCLLKRDLHPRTLGRGEWSSLQPLLAVEERMRECHGAVVVAFERMRIARGVDRAGKAADEQLDNQGLPTVWNQIEAAMAYGLRLPLLVIVEEGLRSEGLLEARYDWAVVWLPVDPAALDTPQCAGVIEDWKKRVLAKRLETEAALEEAGRAEKTLGEKTIGEILGELKPGQLRLLVAVLAGSLTTVVAVAFSLGAKFFG